MRNTGPGEAQAGIKIAGRNISNLRYALPTWGSEGSTVSTDGFFLKKTPICFKLT